MHRCRINPRVKRTLLRKKLKRRLKLSKQQLTRKSDPSHSRTMRMKLLSRPMIACLRSSQPIAPLEISLQILIKLARLQLRENRHHYNKRAKTQESLVAPEKHQSQGSCRSKQLPINCSDFTEERQKLRLILRISSLEGLIYNSRLYSSKCLYIIVEIR